MNLPAERQDLRDQSTSRSPTFSQVGDGRELQPELVRRGRVAGANAFRRSRGSLQASYTLSRSYLDGVDFFLTMRGTQRTPHERGYNPSDQRHNLTIAGTVQSAVGLRGQRHPEARQRRADQGAGGSISTGTRFATGDLPDGHSDHGRTRARGRNRWPRSTRFAPDSIAGRSPDRSRRCSRWIRIGRWTCALTRSWRIGRDRRLELLIEGFNVTNRVNLRPPTGLGRQHEHGVVPRFARPSYTRQFAVLFSISTRSTDRWSL